MTSLARMVGLANGVARNTGIYAKSGKGSWVTDIHGKRYLDMTAGIGALSTGHCHPTVIQAVQQQASEIVHAQQNCVATYPAQVELISKMSHQTPDSLDAFYFVNSGTEAVENAVKLARKATGKPNIISCLGGFHGRTLGCMTLSTSRTSCRKGYQPLLPGIFHIEYPEADCIDWPTRLDSLFDRVTDPTETAAFIMEPVLGEGGIRMADPDHVKYLREVCDRHNILWISDEVQTGVGRTGTFWGYEHFGVEPDIITFAKGIASGFPFAGVISKQSHFDTIHPNGLGGTYNGNAVSTAAASATLDVLDEGNYITECQARGEFLTTAINDLYHPRVVEIRAYGLMIAIELDYTREEFSEFMDSLEDYGIMALTTGIGSTVRLLPPLTITDEESTHFVQQFARALSKTRL